MSLTDRAPAHVRAIAPYQPGKPISELARELGLDEASIVKLASNENPLGVSEPALAAMTRALADVTRYPDGSAFELKAAISRRFGVQPAQVVLGNGSNDVLEIAARAFVPRRRQRGEQVHGDRAGCGRQCLAQERDELRVAARRQPRAHALVPQARARLGQREPGGATWIALLERGSRVLPQVVG